MQNVPKIAVVVWDLPLYENVKHADGTMSRAGSKHTQDVLALFQIADGRWPQGLELELNGAERFEAHSIGSSPRHH